MKKSLKVISISLAAAIVLLLPACQGKLLKTDVPTTKVEKTTDKSVATNITNNDVKADIKYPQFVNDEVKNSPQYKEAILLEDSVIITNNIVTSQKPVKDFMSKLEAKEDCKLKIYTFVSQNTTKCLYYHTLGYDSKTGKMFETDKTSDYTNLTENQVKWEMEHKYKVKSISLTKYGYLKFITESSSEPVYTQVISNYEIFDDYDSMTTLSKKYVEPIYYPIALGQTFDSPKSVTSWLEIMERIVDSSIDKPNESFWTQYPDGKISVDEMMKYLNLYFEVDSADVLKNIKPNFIKGDTIQYLGGLGGAYPDVLVYNVAENGDTAKVICRLRSTITGDVDEKTSYIITIKHMSDNTFRYISLEKSAS